MPGGNDSRPASRKRTGTGNGAEQQNHAGHASRAHRRHPADQHELLTVVQKYPETPGLSRYKLVNPKSGNIDTCQKDAICTLSVLLLWQVGRVPIWELCINCTLAGRYLIPCVREPTSRRGARLIIYKGSRTAPRHSSVSGLGDAAGNGCRIGSVLPTLGIWRFPRIVSVSGAVSALFPEWRSAGRGGGWLIVCSSISEATVR